MAAETEFAVRDSLSKTLMETAVALELVKAKTGNFNTSITAGMGEVEKAIHKTAESFLKLKTGIGETTRASLHLKEALGLAGLLGSFVGLGKALDIMSVSALNLHATAKELGMTGQQFSQLREVYERLGFTTGEAGQKVAATSNILRDMRSAAPALKSPAAT